jgi:hypothetical protein
MMTPKSQAEEKLLQMLQVAGLPVKASYCTSEVCAILGIHERTFWRLLDKYELDERGQLARPDCLDSFTLANNRRVVYHELVSFLERNKTYTRQLAVHPDQTAFCFD